MSKNLMSFHVTHQDRNKEYSSVVIADSKLSASKFVKGIVMHVSEGRQLDEGVQSESGYCMSMFQPRYKQPSKDWIEYLRSINENKGYED